MTGSYSQNSAKVETLRRTSLLMTVYEIPESRWAIKLAPQLSGRAQEAYTAMNMATATDYKKVKKAIRRWHDINEETYRISFRSARRKNNEACRELVTRLNTLATKGLAG
jgi:hypothetical protein